MARRRFGGHHAGMQVNTARVTADPSPAQGVSPVTGYPYLDAVLDQPGSVIAMAHRGGARHPEIPGTENTVHAFRHAVALGYRYLETDVHTTSDGVLLAFHDSLLDRVTDRLGKLADLTAEEIAPARIMGEHAVPTMAELFEEFPDCRFNIDLKSLSAAAALADLLERTGNQDRVLVGSFSQRRLDDFRHATEGRVATSAAPPEVALFLALPSARAARLATRRRVAALQVPHRRGRLPVVTSALVRRAHAAGAHVHVWTVDEPSEMDELLDLGVDGLITDRTDVLKEVLTRRGQWRDHP
jgi:glycerophosphoryl diester phosphodiesterase